MRRIENKILLYFKMVANGCKGYIENCDYSPYFCGYSKSSDRTVNTYELCLFETDIIKCPGEIEKHYTDKHNKSTFRSILRAIKVLEKKGYIERTEGTVIQDIPADKWNMAYKLARHLNNYDLA